MPREKLKARWRNGYTVHRDAAGKTIRVFLLYSTWFILWNPVAMVQAVSLMFSFNWLNAIALIVMIVGGFVIGVILVHFYDSQVWKQIFDYFRDFEDCRFEPITIELEQNLIKIRDIFRNGLGDSAAKNIFLSSFLKPGIRAFFVTGPVPPSSPTTYSMASGTSYVFVGQRPEEMKPFRRFLFFHEIGHATVVNWMFHVQGWFAVFSFCSLFVFVAFHREAGILALLVALTLAVLWAYFWQQQGYTDETLKLELMADAFALVHLARSPDFDFRPTIVSIARMWRKQSKHILYPRFRVRLLVRHAQILSRTGTESSLRRDLDKNVSEQMVLRSPLWLSLLSLAGMLWLGATLSIKNLQELLALSLIWVVVPAVWHYYYMVLSVHLPRTARARREALAFLQAHAPLDLPGERQVKTVFDLMSVEPNKRT